MCLQAQTVMYLVVMPILPPLVLQEVTRVELHPGLVSPKLEHSPGAATVLHDGNLPHTLPVRGRAENIVDVVPTGDAADLARDLRRVAEVEGSPRDGPDLAGRDELVVNRGDMGGEDFDPVLEDGAALMTAEVPVGVLR